MGANDFFPKQMVLETQKSNQPMGRIAGYLRLIPVVREAALARFHESPPAQFFLEQ